MRLAHAILAGIALAALVGWWTLGHPGYETRQQHAARVEAARAAQEPRLYRWHDRHGVLQLTDKPPSGRKYEVVSMREDVNVIPMSTPEPAPAR